MVFGVGACGMPRRLLFASAIALFGTGAALSIDGTVAWAGPDGPPGRVKGQTSSSGGVSVRSADDSSDMSFSATIGGIADLLSRLSEGEVDPEEFEVAPSSAGDAARIVLPPPSAPPRFDVWFEGSRRRAAPGSDQARSGTVFVGADYKLTPAITAGALAGHEWAELGDADGNGSWTSGPYVRVRLMPKLFLSGLAAWDRQTVDDDPLPFARNLDAERRRLRGDLSGAWQSGAWRFAPSLVYTLEGPATGAAPVLGALSFNPAISYRHERPDGTVIEPRLAITGAWEAGPPSGAEASAGPGPLEGLDAKLEGGVQFKDAEGWSIDASTNLSGIEDPQAAKEWSGRLGVKVPLN